MPPRLFLLLALAGCSAGDPRRAPAMADAPLAERLARADADAGARLFGQCAACHTIREGAGDRNGPGLYGVLGRPVASGSPRFGYTEALKARGGTWTFERMDAWLRDPRGFARGTQMLFPGVPNGTDRADLIAYLNRNGSNLPLPGPGHAP